MKKPIASNYLFVSAMRPGERVARFQAETDALAQVESGPMAMEHQQQEESKDVGEGEMELESSKRHRPA
jgi:hypothetical protein